MKVCIARQPIFSVHKKLYAYELLFRGDNDECPENLAGDKATTSLLSSTFLTEGIEKISGTKPCFVNFTEKLLLQNVAAAFPQNRLVVEILEDVEPTPHIIAACKELKKQGYLLALDDFLYYPRFDPLLSIVDIVKIDFIQSPVDSLHLLLHKLSRFDHLKLLAEKVESYEEFEKAVKMGFHYFQGFFFSKPEKICIQELSSVKVNLLRLLAEVTKKKTTIARVEAIVSSDVALTYKLLRYLNSAHFYLLEKVESVARAVTFLGAKRFRRFVLLAIISELATDKPEELVRLAVVRARFCELLADENAVKKVADELFLVGLFSLVDAMLDKTMASLMQQMPLSEDVKNGLILRIGPYALILEAVEYYERGETALCVTSLEESGISAKDLGAIYIESLKYGERLLASF